MNSRGSFQKLPLVYSRVVETVEEYVLCVVSRQVQSGVSVENVRSRHLAITIVAL